MTTPLIEIRGLTKHFGGAIALSEVSFDILPGEVHAVCGENGAGKSTLNRILSGQVVPTSGEILFEGKPLSFGSVREAEQKGIAIVHQETTVVPDLTAVENIFLGRELKRGPLLDRAKMAAAAAELMQNLGETINLRIPTRELPLAQRQMVGIARAVGQDCKLLILDEPTASLSARETESLFKVVRSLQSRGVAVLYVSHRLAEVSELCQRVTVLRDGRHVLTRDIAELGREGIVRSMVGRELVALERDSFDVPGQELLRVEDLTRSGEFESVSLQVFAGETVVLTGLIGAGRTELARAICGFMVPDSGTVIKKGAIAYVPEDRKDEGLWLDESVSDNLAMSRRGWIGFSKETSQAESAIQTFGIKCPSPSALVGSLSGGIQQKVLLAKWIETHPQVLILDEPTRGVDVGAKEEIYAEIDRLKSQGLGILCISSDLPEVIRLGDRVLVMAEGRVQSELSRPDATEELILDLALPKSEGVRREQTTTRGIRLEAWLAGIIGLMFLFTTVKNPTFLSVGNLSDMLVKIAPTIIVGAGLTFVILAREIDISVGSLLGTTAATLGICASTDHLGLPPGVAILASLGIGTAVGLLNGVLVAYAGIPSIIVTLGMLTILRGVTEQMLGGKWIEHIPDGLRNMGTSGLVVWVAVFSLGFGWVLLNRTSFGKHVVALGSDPEAAGRVGLPIRKLRVSIFALTGFLTAVAAVLSATQLQKIESGFGFGFEIAVIGAVVVGGTSIRGGKGSLSGTLLGGLLLGTFGTALIFLKLDDRATYFERALQGLLILASVLLSGGKREE